MKDKTSVSHDEVMVERLQESSLCGRILEGSH